MYQLRNYQEEDVQFGLKVGSVINANPPGLGKTLETLATLERLPQGSILVISPKMATGVWKYEAHKWLNWDSVRITGEFNKDERKAIREEFDRGNTRILIINSAMIEEIQAWRSVWKYIVVDEAHLLGLLNPKSKTFELMCKFHYERIFVLTGTPVRKGPQDLWTLLHLVNQRKFPNYWSFVYKYCHVNKTRFGTEILSRPKHPSAFNEMIYKYMIRRKKQDVLKDLPDKIRQTYMISALEGQQAEVYRQMQEDMIAEIPNSDDLLVAQTKMTQVLRLQQLLVCPRILGVPEDGVALNTLVEYLIPQEFEQKRAVVIATPFRQAIPFVSAAIKQTIDDVHVEVIHGKIEETAQEVAQRFQEHKSHRKVLIYTIKSGASWTAHTASTGFMLGYDWSAINNLQAEDRIHRLGQLDNVIWKYLLHEGTVDETVMARLDERAMGMGWTLETKDFLLKKQQMKEEYFKH